MGLGDTKRVQRLLRAVARNPKNCAFEDLESLLLAVGFVARRTSGSHVFFKRGSLAISVPRHKPVKEVYVEQALALIAQIAD